jgi:hypothetical protein
MTLQIVPVTRDQAHAAITTWHRHHRPPQGYRYAVGCAAGDRLVGVATAGRPVARHLDDGQTIEVTRVATDGTPHACSALYGACWRAARALGYTRAVTYTQTGESGASLRAAGWLHAATRAARHGWDMPGRRRDDGDYEPVGRLLWVIEASGPVQLPTVWPQRAEQHLSLFTGAHNSLSGVNGQSNVRPAAPSPAAGRTQTRRAAA